MTALIVFALVVSAAAVVGLAVGIIVAGRIDRVLAPHAPEPSAGPPAGPSASSPPEEEPS